MREGSLDDLVGVVGVLARPGQEGRTEARSCSGHWMKRSAYVQNLYSVKPRPALAA